MFKKYSLFFQIPNVEMGKIIIKSVSDNGQRNGGTSIFEFVFQYQIQDVTKQNVGLTGSGAHFQDLVILCIAELLLSPNQWLCLNSRLFSLYFSEKETLCAAITQEYPKPRHPANITGLICKMVTGCECCVVTLMRHSVTRHISHLSPE